MKVKIHRRMKSADGSVGFSVEIQNIQNGSLKVLKDSQVIFNSIAGYENKVEFFWQKAAPPLQAEELEIIRFELLDSEETVVADVLKEVIKMRENTSF